MPERADVVAAGAVVIRSGEVLLVHRPKYDDWSFPKGKLEPGEHVLAAAVREVAEETGLDIGLGPPLSTQRYELRTGQPRTKQVHYWTGRVRSNDDVSTYSANDEIDRVAWVPREQARRLLTYDYDRATLAEASRAPAGTAPLVVLRHCGADPRTSWTGDDRDRPLTTAGERQAGRVVALLGAYGVRRVLSSSSRRCRASVTPYAEAAGVDLETSDSLTEEDATPDTVSAHVQRLLDEDEPAVLCTHRRVLPSVFEALALADRALAPGALFVAHHRGGEVVAVEQHDAAAH